MNPNRDTARLLNYKETLKEKNLVAVSLVDCVSENREFAKLDFTATHKSNQRPGFIQGFQSHVVEHSLPQVHTIILVHAHTCPLIQLSHQGIKLVMLDYMWLPVSQEWLLGGYLSNDFGLLQNIATLARGSPTKVHLVEGARVIIPTNVSCISCMLVHFCHTLLICSCLPPQYVMWNLMTKSKHWDIIVDLFDVSHLRLDETLEECHPLVKSDTQINTLIGRMGKGESQTFQVHFMIHGHVFARF